MSRHERRFFRIFAAGVGLALVLDSLVAAAILPGSALALKSDGSASGSAYVLDRNGFVGTYITLATPGTVSLNVSAIGSGGASMGIVVGDFRKDFTPTSGLYSASLDLPAGTHFVRTELNNDPGTSGRNLQINSLEVVGAAFANTHDSANALAASDTYIQNFRRGRVKITGLPPGAFVNVTLQRLSFDLGAGASYDRLVETPQYQQRFAQNFNMAVCRCYWRSNEPSPGIIDLEEVHGLQAYANAHSLTTRLHTAIWEGAEPTWATSLRVSGDAVAAREAVLDRLDYYVTTGYDEIDLYNESWHAASEADSYWTLFGGAAGIADLYQYAARKAPGSKMFVNDFEVLQGSPNSFGRHIDSIGAQNIGGIGLQYYTSNYRDTSARDAFYALQNMNVRDLPIVLTEFGTFEAVAQPELVLNHLLRLMFGNAESTGFAVWDWLNQVGNEDFAPWSALYTVDPADWNTISITDTGRMWQDMLGIADWDGNPNNGWNTQLATTVGADGSIIFNGYYGDYKITVDGQSHDLSLVKGTTTYNLGPVLPGDFNQDGRVDAADYSFWRDRLGITTHPFQYEIWKSNFGRTLDSQAAAVPESSALALACFASLGLSYLCRRHRPKLSLSKSLRVGLTRVEQRLKLGSISHRGEIHLLFALNAGGRFAGGFQEAGKSHHIFGAAVVTLPGNLSGS